VGGEAGLEERRGGEVVRVARAVGVEAVACGALDHHRCAVDGLERGLGLLLRVLVGGPDAVVLGQDVQDRHPDVRGDRGHRLVPGDRVA